MTEAYVGLGSNVGDRLKHLQAAIAVLAKTPGVSLLRQSLVYETAPVGGVSQADYLNQVVVVDTSLSPRGLWLCLRNIEASQHRLRGQRWGARSIDLDLLFFDAVQQTTPELILPHPQIANRRFVLVPLLEVAHGPVLAQVAQWLTDTADTQAVRPYLPLRKETHGQTQD